MKRAIKFFEMHVKTFCVYQVLVLTIWTVALAMALVFLFPGNLDVGSLYFSVFYFFFYGLLAYSFYALNATKEISVRKRHKRFFLMWSSFITLAILCSYSFLKMYTLGTFHLLFFSYYLVEMFFLQVGYRMTEKKLPSLLQEKNR